MWVHLFWFDTENHFSQCLYFAIICIMHINFSFLLHSLYCASAQTLGTQVNAFNFEKPSSNKHSLTISAQCGMHTCYETQKLLLINYSIFINDFGSTLVKKSIKKFVFFLVRAPFVFVYWYMQPNWKSFESKKMEILNKFFFRWRNSTIWTSEHCSPVINWTAKRNAIRKKKNVKSKIYTQHSHTLGNGNTARINELF